MSEATPCTCRHPRHLPGECSVPDPDTVTCGCMWGRPSEIDVERLARAMGAVFGNAIDPAHRRMAQRIAAEYTADESAP